MTVLKPTTARLLHRILQGLLLVSLFPTMVWGQCPYSGSNVITSSTTKFSGTSGLPVTILKGSKVSITPDNLVNYTVTAESQSMTSISDTLEIFGNLKLDDGQGNKLTNICICNKGVVVVNGNLTLGNLSNIIVNSGGVIIVLGNVSGQQGNIDLDNDGKVILAGTVTLNSSTFMDQSSGSSYIFDSTFLGKVDVGSGTKGDFDDLIAKDPDLLNYFTQYTCPDALPMTLVVDPSTNINQGTPVKLKANSTKKYDEYKFYKTGGVSITPPSPSPYSDSTLTINNDEANPIITDNDVVYVYAKSISGCFQAASTSPFVVGISPARVNSPRAPSPILKGTPQTDVETDRTNNINDHYVWQVIDKSTSLPIPGTSFTYSTNDPTNTISWSSTFVGTAMVRVAAANNGGNGFWSDWLEIEVLDIDPGTITCAEVPICFNAGSIVAISNEQLATVTPSEPITYSWQALLDDDLTWTSLSGTAENQEVTTMDFGERKILKMQVRRVATVGSFAAYSNAITVNRTPITGPPYHIGNSVAH